MATRTLPGRRQRTERRSLTGSVTSRNGGKGAVISAGGGRVQAVEPWQVRGWMAFDAVAEMAFGFNFMAETIGRIDPQIGVKTPQGIEPIGDGAGKLPPDVLGAAQQALDELRVGDDGLGGLIERLALNKYVAGQYWLVPPQNPGINPWTVHSVLEARAMPALQDRVTGAYVGPGGAQITFEDGSQRTVVNAIKVHKPHPARAYLATGPLRAMLDVAEECEMLVRQIKAVAMSKLINGLFIIPTELQILDGDGQPLDFGEELDLAFKAAILDHGSTESVTPLIARCPAELMKTWQYVTFEKGIDDGIIARLDNSVARLANGMPMPAEIILGLGTTTHWNAREIDENLYKGFVGPEGDWHYTRILSKVIRPRVMQLLGSVDDPWAPGAMNDLIIPGDVANIACWWDEGALIAHPDKSNQALALYGNAFRPNFGISGQGVREMTDIPEHFAPTPEEIEARLSQAERLNIRITEAGTAPAGTELPLDTTDTTGAP